MGNSSNIQTLDESSTVGKSIMVANSKSIPINHIGNSKVKIGDINMILKDILHASSIKKNILSVNRLCVDNPVLFMFDNYNVFLKDQDNNRNLAIECAKDGLCELDFGRKIQVNNCQSATLKTWHNCLGQLCENKTREMVNIYNLPYSNKNFIDCKSCIVSKMHHFPYTKTHNIYSFPLDIVFADVWGPTLKSSFRNSKYYLLFVDDATKFNWYFPLTCQSKVKKIFVEFKTYVEKLIRRSIKAIQTDNEENLLH